jgi:hypothetical protein
METYMMVIALMVRTPLGQAMDLIQLSPLSHQTCESEKAKIQKEWSTGTWSTPYQVWADAKCLPIAK